MQNSFHEFVRSRIEVSQKYMGPFCPFSPAYCNEAYTERCYTCFIAEQDYFEIKDEFMIGRCDV